MTKTIVKNKEQWRTIMIEAFEELNGFDGLGIEDYKKDCYYYGNYEPESYPFILVRGDYVSGCKFNHEKMMIIYPKEFNNNK